MHMPKAILFKIPVQIRTGYQCFNVAKFLTNGHLLVDVKGASNFQWWLLSGKSTFQHPFCCQQVSVSTESTLSQRKIPSGTENAANFYREQGSSETFQQLCTPRQVEMEKLTK